MVVEGDAGREHVDQPESLVPDAGLDHRHQLVLVSGEAPRDERTPLSHGHLHRVDGLLLVDLALLGLGAHVRGGGKLPLGQAVDTIVLDDVEHVEIAAQRMRELAQPDGQGVAVAGDADQVEPAVGGAGAGGDGGHPAVDGVEAVGGVEKIRRRLRRAADAAQLGHLVRRNVQLEEGLDDGRGHRVVAAAGAQRGHAAFVVADGQPQCVAGQPLVDDLRFGDECHAASPRATEASIASTTQRLSMGSPL